MRCCRIIFAFWFLLIAVSGFAQEHINPEDRVVDLNSPTFVPMVHIGKAKVGSDSIQYVRTNKIYIFPPMEFKNDKQRQTYNRLVANIKKVLPLAKECNQIILETGAYLQTIPYGRTVTYGQIAKELDIHSAQAVGGAVGRNPFSIIVPCHRVLGSQGQLTGYAGGLDKKIWLLEHEGVELSEKALNK